jgi:hypothetical protein
MKEEFVVVERRGDRLSVYHGSNWIADTRTLEIAKILANVLNRMQGFEVAQ